MPTKNKKKTQNGPNVSPKDERADANTTPKQQSKTIVPESPALSSATTLRGSPIMPFSSLKPGVAFSPLTPLKEDGLFSKDVNTSGMDELPLPPDVKAVADLLENMKRTLRAMQSTVSVLGRQTEKAAVLAPAIKVNQELAHLREILEKRTQEQADEVAKLQQRLEEELKEAISGKLKDQAMEMLKEAVSKKVHERVQTQLNSNIPSELRHQVKSHRRQVLEIKTNIHNINARSFNSSLRSTTDTLRPLLRPLPSAEQSPPHAGDISAPDATAAPTPSDRFPSTLGELWSLSAEQAKQLVADYGLSKSTTPSPSSTNSKKTSSTAGGEREEDINKLMHHIGVPFKLLPVPISASQSQAGKRLLSPLIIATNEVDSGYGL
ncbi:hypothetical protein VKT23_001158 [Stygiomarasmius scandens]|uniref:Uncharacterized protein n=1 Tax=Marasmiellus scandens TaxID=2682957 RepID=A0ABR1K6M4_9AGAR